MKGFKNHQGFPYTGLITPLFLGGYVGGVGWLAMSLEVFVFLEAFFFSQYEGGGKEVLGHSALQKWNTLNHYPILQRSASTYHESQSLHDIIISSCLITLHALSFRSTSKNSRDSILCVILCVHKNVVFGVLLPTPFVRTPNARKLCSNLRWRWICVEEPGTWDLSSNPSVDACFL